MVVKVDEDELIEHWTRGTSDGHHWADPVAHQRAEVAAPQCPASRSGEDQRRSIGPGVGVEVFADCRKNCRRDSDRAHARPGLGRADEERAGVEFNVLSAHRDSARLSVDVAAAFPRAKGSRSAGLGWVASR
jgi:hypothetical protein